MSELPHLLLLLSLMTSVAPGPRRTRNESDHASNKPCTLVEYAGGAHCVQSGYRLVCSSGFTTQWTKGVKYEITHLRVLAWPGDCFNIGRLQYFFPELRLLEFINCTALTTFKGHFNATNKIEKLSMHGLMSLWEIPVDMMALMPDLKELDLRGNVLRHMRARILRGPARLNRVYLSDNKWDCSDGGLDWLAMERDNSTVKKKIMDYTKLVCHQQLYRGKPLHVVMDIIRTVRQTCPSPCDCAMTHVVSNPKNDAIVPIITVDCAGKLLESPPQKLPNYTTTLRLEGNKINTIRGITQNPQYLKLADLYLDNNSISAVKELEGSEWFTTFRVLSLRGNKLKQIPVYAFDKAFQGNNNIMNVFLGHNPWRCDCHFIPRFQGLLLKYKRVIRDLSDIRCSHSSDKALSFVQISTMALGNVCKSGVEMPISTINIINLTLTFFILLVIGRFLYDWHNFKTTGKLPWISSILP